MGFPIKVKSNFKEVDRWLKTIYSKQVPFATSQAINQTAKDVRKEIVTKTMPRDFKLRNRGFATQTMRIIFSKKNKLTAFVGNIANARFIDYLNLHVEGGTKTPRGNHIAIPTVHTKRGAKGVPPAKRPRQLMAKGKSYVTSVNGTKVIIEKTSKKKPGKVKFILTPSAKIDKRFRFFEDGNKVVDKVFKGHFVKAFTKAILTAR
jgi:hypothetical protein